MRGARHILHARCAGRSACFALLRLVGVIWIIGFIVLALAAPRATCIPAKTSPSARQRWQTRLRMSLIWPIALLSVAGRARLRRG